jgi:hypothetical protein
LRGLGSTSTVPLEIEQFIFVVGGTAKPVALVVDDGSYLVERE